MADNAVLEPGRDYVVKHTTRTVRADSRAGLPARCQHPASRQDRNTKLNELGRVSLRTQVPLLPSEYPQR